MSFNPQKRSADVSALVAVPQNTKRFKNNELVLSNKDKQLMEKGVKRTSNLFSPIIRLEGHESDVFTCEFHPDGEYLASSGFDRKIFLW